MTSSEECQETGAGETANVAVQENGNATHARISTSGGDKGDGDVQSEAETIDHVEAQEYSSPSERSRSNREESRHKSAKLSLRKELLKKRGADRID